MQKAAKACNLKETDTRELRLFRINGVQILHKNLTVVKKQEMDHRKLLKSYKEISENTKFGIGHIKWLSDEETPDN